MSDTPQDQSSTSEKDNDVVFTGHTAVKGPKFFSGVDNDYGDEDDE